MTVSHSRRDFLRLAGGAAAAAALGAGCSGSGTDPQKEARSATASGRSTLRIAQWNSYVSGYDRWWDEEYTRRWSERNGIEVVVDHFDNTQAAVHAEAEVAIRRGHDIFQLNLASPAAFEDEVIDHREVVEEVEAKVGKMTPLVERTVFNPRTQKYFGFSDFWASGPVHYRRDFWDPIGLRPDTWEDVLAAGSRLKAQGHPIGIGLSGDLESNLILVGLMHSFGASIQDEEANVAINTPAAVEAVKMGTAVFRSAMTDEVLGWDTTSNNRALVSGQASLILNSIAAMRAIEAQDPDLAAKVELSAVPQGPGGRFGTYAVGMYMIWRFSKNQEAAKQFLVDLASDYREAFIRSQYLQIPSFPGAVPGLGELVANDPRSQPPRKYALLAGAAEWTTNVGHPGYSNAATDEVVKKSLISKMFATAARGEKTAEEAVADAEAEIKPIFDKWRERRKI